MSDEGWSEDAVDAAGGIDLLLTDAALGVWHRLRPDSSLLRLAGELARRPGFVGRQAGSLATELGRVALGRSSVAANTLPPPAYSTNVGTRSIASTSASLTVPRVAFAAARGSTTISGTRADASWKNSFSPSQ